MGKQRETNGNFQNLILKTDNEDSITRCRKASRHGKNNNSFSISEMYTPEENTRKRSYK